MAERELINPHDKIFLCVDDIDAARMAVLLVGGGHYAIQDDDMPVFLLDGHSGGWFEKTYGHGVEEVFKAVGLERIAAALESFRHDGEPSSLSDPVKRAHVIAKAYRDHLAKEADHA